MYIYSHKWRIILVSLPVIHKCKPEITVLNKSKDNSIWNLEYSMHLCISCRVTFILLNFIEKKGDRLVRYLKLWEFYFYLKDSLLTLLKFYSLEKMLLRLKYLNLCAKLKVCIVCFKDVWRMVCLKQYKSINQRVI